MRFLHIADLHLDSAFASRSGEGRERPGEGAPEAFQRAVDVAIEDDLDAFGRPSGLDTGPEPLGDLIVVPDSDASGGRTLFSFLTTALYVVRPASRYTRPYARWRGGGASGAMKLEGGDGTVEEIAGRIEGLERERDRLRLRLAVLFHLDRGGGRLLRPAPPESG